MKNSHYTGVLPPITTPFENDEVALDKLKSNLVRYNKPDCPVMSFWDQTVSMFF